MLPNFTPRMNREDILAAISEKLGFELKDLAFSVQHGPSYEPTLDKVPMELLKEVLRAVHGESSVMIVYGKNYEAGHIHMWVLSGQDLSRYFPAG